MYQLRTDKWLRRVNCHTYIIHGTRDRLIPIKHSEKLQQIDPHKITLIRIHGGGHNNLPSFPEYHNFIRDILKKLTTIADFLIGRFCDFSKCRSKRNPKISISRNLKIVIIMPKRKMLFRWIKIILLLYGLIGIAIYYFQDTILFHPEKMAKDHAYHFAVPHKEINIAL